jgi:LysM repeat protein
MKRLKIPRLFKAKKLSAATARRASASGGMDFEGIPEPNMKLSRALLIVLLLHVVAVSGIIAFNAIKTRERPFVPPGSSEAENKPTETTQAATHASTDKSSVAATQRETDRQPDSKLSHSPTKNEQSITPSSSGKTYVVKKGDNPVGIAKKLKVPYNDLMALNHIDDPRKLQIGQKLLVPEAAKGKAPSAKAADKKKKKNEISSEKSDAKTHGSSKVPRAKSTDTSTTFRATFWSAQASSHRCDALKAHAS